VGIIRRELLKKKGKKRECSWSGEWWKKKKKITGSGVLVGARMGRKVGAHRDPEKLNLQKEPSLLPLPLTSISQPPAAKFALQSSFCGGRREKEEECREGVKVF
jgi:hypothetical protein